MKKYLRYTSLVVFAVLFSNMYGQGIVWSNDIPVIENGDTLASAWAGGLNSPQFSPVDLDNDGTKDMIVFDRYGYSLLPFVNGGTAGTVDYTFDPQYKDRFPDDLDGWVLMRDYDGDGYEDLFASTIYNTVRVYRNDAFATGVLNFVPVFDTLKTEYAGTGVLNLRVQESDVPHFGDIDGDGDIDCLNFAADNLSMEWHKNVSVDSGWGMDSLRFVVQSNCFGHFVELGSGCSAAVDLTPCAAGERIEATDDYFEEQPEFDSEMAPIHAGSSVLAMDLNNDGLTELMIGDVACYGVYAMYNNGTSSVANFNIVEPKWPQADVGISVRLFAALFHMDFDNDGVMDLAAAPNMKELGPDFKDGVQYYKNTASDTLPAMEFQTNGFMQRQMIDWGSGSNPVPFDYNADGLMDLLVGNQNYWDTAAFEVGTLFLYENVGTVSSPVFELVDSNYANIDSINKDYVYPTLGDLDDDGDLDMLLGEKWGRLSYYENTAGPGATANFQFVTANYEGINVFSRSAPHLYDLDGDNDLDLVIGTMQGKIQLWENTGDSTFANFDTVTTFWGKIDIDTDTAGFDFNGDVKPYLFDYDGDMQVELLLGTQSGRIRIYEDVTFSATDTFSYVGDLLNTDFGQRTSVSAASLDGTENVYYFIGDDRGGMHLAYGTMVTDAPEDEISLEEDRLLLFPNPASQQVRMKILGNSKTTKMSAEIFNMLGQQILTGSGVGKDLNLDLAGVAPGMYNVIVTAGDKKFTEKLLVR